MKDMKRVIMIMVLGALTACLVPALAQTPQDWKSTSSMPSTGSTYAPQVTAVGAATVATTATTTTENYSPAKVGGPRRTIDTNNEWEDDGDQGFPIGDALLPMLLCAAVFCGVIALRRKRSALKS